MDPNNPVGLIHRPEPEIPNNDNNPRNRVFIALGAVILVGAGLYFIFARSSSPPSQSQSEDKPENQVKLIDQTINTISGTVVAVDFKTKNFLVSSADGKNYTVAFFPQTTWVNLKDDSSLKKDMTVKVGYIDAQKEIGLLYAANIEKIK